MSRRASSRKVIYAAMAGNLLVAICKFVAGGWTGGSAMLAEGVHSLVDTGNEGLLLYGLRQAERRPDPTRPFGYGRELYFWSFIVALLIFSLGAGVAMLEGVLHILNPRPIEDAYINYLVIGAAFIFEGGSWWIAISEMGGLRTPNAYLRAFRRTKDPASFMVLFEDSAALIGLMIAFLGTWGSATFAMPVLDGIASMCIGLVLGATAVLLATETKSLLIGEPATAEVVKSIASLAAKDTAVLKVNGILTAHLGPDQIVATLSLEFEDDLTTPMIETKVADMEKRIRAAHPDVVALFIKPQSADRLSEARKQRGFVGGQHG